MVHTLKWRSPTALFAVLLLGRLSIADVQQTTKVLCRNIHTVFSESTHGWRAEASPAETFEITPDGLRMNLVPPIAYERLTHKATTLPYNSHMGHGPTLNSTTYMQYGTLSATLKSSKVGGAITALIMIADDGDEIDLELLGSEAHIAQTNYFHGKRMRYTVNGGSHQINGTSTYDDFHTYTIDWMPERIVWSVDGNTIRVKHKNETCSKKGQCEFPSSPARIQLGFWDGSFEFGTAEWAHGPIDWEKHAGSPITSYIKEMTITCNPEYNEIVDQLPDELPSDTLHSTSSNADEDGNSSITGWGPNNNNHGGDQQQDAATPGLASRSASVSHLFLIPHSFLVLLAIAAYRDI